MRGNPVEFEGRGCCLKGRGHPVRGGSPMSV